MCLSTRQFQWTSTWTFLVAASFAVCFTVVLSAGSLQAAPAEVLFYCPFEGDVTAAHASGPDFGIAREERYVAGHKGQAIQIGTSDAMVAYISENNIDKARGSIELWVRPDWPEKDATWQAFVWEEGEGDIGSNTIWLWKYGGALRFDVRDPADTYINTGIAKWKAGEWHHIVATWDCGHGLCLYVDGKLRGEREATWKPQSQGRLFLGNRPPSNDRPAQAAFDELTIYSRPLTAEEVALAYAGKLKRIPAPKQALPKTSTAEDNVAPKLVFHLPLNGDARPKIAAGSAKPVLMKGLSYEPGLFGQACRFTRGSRLRFAEAGNLRKERGTISLWFRPEFSGRETQRENGGEIWRTLFSEGPLPEKRIGSNQLWLWLFGARMRFDVADRNDQYASTGISSWNAREWHHLAVTWNNKSGRTLYLDGAVLSAGSDRRKPFLSMAWDTARFDYFQIGSDERGREADGLIEELKIYDGPLPAKQIKQEYARVYPITLTALHVHYPLGRTQDLRWQIDASVSEPTRGILKLTVTDPSGKTTVAEQQRAIQLRPDTSAYPLSTSFTPQTPGRYQLAVRWTPQSGGVSYEQSCNIWGVDVKRMSQGVDRMELELVKEIDCAQALSSDVLVESAATKIVRAACGAYREAASERNSRFALRFHLPESDCPYLVEWEYPDDKPRTMEMIAQSVNVASSEYELQTGVFTGGEYRLSQSMKTHRCLYYPRNLDVALIFMTAEQDRPVAAAHVRVFRVRSDVEQSQQPKRPAATAHGQRHVGIYYEDPAMCYDFGNRDSMPDFKVLADRLITYMRYSGQDLLMYPGVWYHGPFYPSRSQGTVLQRPHPDNFIEYLLLRFEAEDYRFLPTINLHSLPSLARHKWTDEMVITGEAAAGPLSVGWDGSPNLIGWHGTRPNYNILHPEVRAAVLTMVDEMLELYGDSPAFEGICFHLTKHCILWFGELDAGYNDYCVEAFEKDCGLQMPVAADDPGRSAKRYRWIMANAREKWIDWRCRALREFYGEVAERLAKKRPDLKLVLAMYRPVFRDVVPGPGNVPEGDFVGQIVREGGLDPDLYADLKNVVLDRTIYPADYRWYRAHRHPENDPVTIRDLMTEKNTYGSWAASGRSWVNMHDRYWEDAVGRAGWKSFWGREQGWRVSTLNATEPFALESYLIPLAHADVMTFTKGGFLIGTHGMERPLAEFSRAFRSLPALPFSTLAGVPTPLVVRTLQYDGDLYVYVVNPTQGSASCTLSLGGGIRSLCDLSSGEDVAVGRKLGIRMKPMSFRAYRITGNDLSVAVNQ